MSSKKNLLKLVFLFCLLLFFLFPLFSLRVSAEEEAVRELEIDYPEIQGIQPETVTTGLPEYVSYVFNLGIVIAILILFGSLVYGGVLYLISTGQVARLTAAKERISAAFLGIIILLSSYIILTTINPELVVFHFGPLEQVGRPSFSDSDLIDSDKMTLIFRELPLGQAVKNGIWEEERTDGIEKIYEDLENFFKEEIEIDGTVIKRISDLNKYLKTLTDKCDCGNVKAFCTDFTSGTLPIGCSGDPCFQEVRNKINRILEINSEKTAELLEFQRKINEEKKKLETELSGFAEIEQEILACQSQTKGIYSLSEYLSIKQFYEEQGGEVTALPSYLESRGDPLTFYCLAGGTVFNLPELSAADFSTEDFSFPEVSSEFVLESASCPVEFPVGEVIDQSRELAILLSIKMEQTSYLIEETMKEIRDMADLVSKCNEKNCSVICSCIPNPCYKVCSINPFTWFCCPFAKSKCLQGVGVCVGYACESNEVREEMKKTAENIKKNEDEILAVFKETKQIFPKIDYLLQGEDNNLNLRNLGSSLGLCYGSISDLESTPDWQLLNCQAVVGSYGPDNLVINTCHPRNFFCCSSSGAEPPAFPSVFKERPIFVLFPEKYAVLPSEDNCPKGWLCNPDVKIHNQYKDASEPLKELLACMREELDKVQEEKGIKETLGRITSISDSKLYLGTCSWESGPQTIGGCSHTYTVKDGKETVSAHYGGPTCRYQRASYALDIGISDPYEKKYAYEIIAAAKKCFPSAFILYLVPGHYDHIHIGIGAAYYCGSN
ncbi:MAG TPA: hypothetical protein VMW21_01215 [Patescibacteria group bacterium]|nr:hypothetical protein [Patescibacteria group bacterium]